MRILNMDDFKKQMSLNARRKLAIVFSNKKNVFLRTKQSNVISAF